MAPDGTPAPTVGAFFDLDRTVLSDSSGRLYLRYLHQIGYLTPLRWLAVIGQVGLYISGVYDFPTVMARLTMQIAGQREAEAWRLSAAWFEAQLQHYITAAARERIAWHQGQGHHVALASAATPFAVRPVAQALGLGEAYLATRLAVSDGRFTGRIELPACYRAGKLAQAQAYAGRIGLNLGQSYFYSDSASDLPLLEAVGHPVAVNPDRRLARVAEARQWPVMYFYSRANIVVDSGADLDYNDKQQ